MSKTFASSLVVSCQKGRRPDRLGTLEDLESGLAKVTHVAKNSPAYICGVREGHYLENINKRGLTTDATMERCVTCYSFCNGEGLDKKTVIKVLPSTHLGIKLLPSPSLALQCINKFHQRHLPILPFDYEELIEALIMQGKEEKAKEILVSLNTNMLNKRLSLMSLVSCGQQKKLPAPEITGGTVLLQAAASFKLGDLEDAEQCLERFRTELSAFEADPERFTLYNLIKKSVKFSKNELSQEKLVRAFLDGTRGSLPSFNNFFIRDSAIMQTNLDAFRTVERAQKKNHYLVGRKLHNYDIQSITRGVGSRVVLKSSRKAMTKEQLVVVVYAGRRLPTRVFRRFLQEMSNCCGTLIPHHLAGIHVITRGNRHFRDLHEPTAEWLVRQKFMKTYSELNLQVLYPSVDELDEFFAHLADDGNIPNNREFFSMLVDKKSVIRAVGTDEVYRIISTMEKEAVQKLPVAVSVDENGEPIATAQAYSRRARSVRRQHDNVLEAVEVISESIPFL